MLGMELAGGSLIFLLFVVAFLLAVTYGLYTRAGSGISQRPYGNVYGGAPGAARESRMSGRERDDVRSWSRGTR